MFELLFRGKNVENIEGSGIGLYLANKYAKIIDGKRIKDHFG